MSRFEPLPRSALADGTWTTPVPIRFGDCDPAGIVYTPEYFNLFNGVIEDWYGAALGLPYHVLIGPRRTGLGYVHASADFARPSRMGDVLEVGVNVPRLGRSSLTLLVQAFREGLECVRATFVTVTTSLDDHRPIPIPDDLRVALEAYRAATGASPASGPDGAA